MYTVQKCLFSYSYMTTTGSNVRRTRRLSNALCGNAGDLASNWIQFFMNAPWNTLGRIMWLHISIWFQWFEKAHFTDCRKPEKFCSFDLFANTSHIKWQHFLKMIYWLAPRIELPVSPKLSIEVYRSANVRTFLEWDRRFYRFWRNVQKCEIQ